MSYNPITSFPTYPLDDPLNVWGLASTFEQSLCLDSCVHTQAGQSVSALWSAEPSEAPSYFYAESPLGTREAHDSVSYSHIYSLDFVSTAPHNGMLLMLGYDADNTTRIECATSVSEIDPILLAHPSTYEIASALGDPTHSRDTPVLISPSSSSLVSVPLPYAPSYSPNATTPSPCSVHGANEVGSSRSLSLPTRSSVQSREHRHHPYRRNRARSSCSVSASDSSSPSPRAGGSNARRSPRHTRRRNVQVDGKVPEPEDMDEPGMVKCKSCDLVLLKSSMKRHVETHGLPGKWSCCGVPVELASEYGIPASAEPYEHKGRWMRSNVSFIPPTYLVGCHELVLGNDPFDCTLSASITFSAVAIHDIQITVSHSKLVSDAAIPDLPTIILWQNMSPESPKRGAIFSLSGDSVIV
ncbi:predicted protein [Postia placenta Mad-698-R]|uniref:C2H2-type domain-containing protein n=1 Tax=Postia placenta MAD-698-R-SB12 TaxID=670580 RepID=A0A1X6N0G9_9APHY|nr:hypothetical protein POSPLADRAFT_1143113 [Postia placenta MAD-698-R-SB12]EED80388.1 predicted protein [Postia placenta Mad-698-R]OSX62111.1 hypothetical protein POSPLADRAFT_1143113 [Postia placenta MAD-698-R-SB12]